jgi:hypothetical protein
MPREQIEAKKGDKRLCDAAPKADSPKSKSRSADRSHPIDAQKQRR